MEIALIAAKIIGVYLVVSGLFLLFRGKTVPHLLKDFFKHPALLYLSGAVLIFLSTLYLLIGNVWDNTWHTVITIIMWLVFIKGVMYILFPDTLENIAKRMMVRSINLYGIIAIVIGIWLYFIA